VHAGQRRQARESFRSRLPVLGVPEQFEIGDQRRAEMALRLLAGIERGVLAEGVERLGGASYRILVSAVDSNLRVR